MLADTILDLTTTNTSSTPHITGNDIPDDVWRIIAGLVSEGSYILQYMGVNHTFYNYALDQKYREVRWFVMDQRFSRQLERLQSPLIARHVRVLHIRAWFIQYLLKRDILFDSPSSLHKANGMLKDALLSIASTLGINSILQTSRGYDPQWMLQHKHERSKDGSLSFESTINSMIKAVAGMTNVMEFNFEWRDLPVNTDTLVFLTSTRASFDNSLRKLTLRAPISKFKELMPNTNFNNIEELDFHFDYRAGGNMFETPDPYVHILLETVVPFIARRRATLQSLNISSSSSTDLSAFFNAIPSNFASLRRFGVDISFHKDFLSDPSGICQLLESCTVSLRHVTLLANWEHGHLDSVSKSQSANNDPYTRTDANNINPQSDNKPWVRMNNLLLARPMCLSSLRSLEIPFVSLSNTLPLIRRSCDTLTRLCLRGRYLTRNEAAEVIGLFSHRSLEIQHLEIAVALLDFALLVMLAKGLPDLVSLILIYEKHHDDLEYPSSDNALAQWNLSLLEVHDGRFRGMDVSYRYHFTSERVTRQTISLLLHKLRSDRQ